MLDKMWKNVLIFSIFWGSGCLATDIKVSVYYETLCPYSVAFLVEQYYPVLLNNSKHLQVDLIPYGKATANNESGSWVFECQHGEAECYGNKVHGCAIELYPVSQSTEFVVCAMNSGNATLDANLIECATASNISWEILEDCLSSGQGDEILAANGRRTDKIIPNLINSIPTIVFNDNFNLQLYRLAYADFKNTFEFVLDQVQCGFCQFNGSNLLLSSVKIVFGFPLLMVLFQKYFI